MYQDSKMLINTPTIVSHNHGAHETRKNESIQVLRAIAALLVIYVHSLDVASAHGAPLQLRLYRLAHFGACGVDIFFAISGFILSTVAIHTHPRPGRRHISVDFLLRRFLRIFPIYWLLSLFWVFIEIRHHHFTIAWLTDSILLIPSLHYPLQSPLLFVGWTLIFEMFFYYLIALNLLAGSRHIVQRTILSIVILTAIGGAVGFHRSIFILIANPINIEFIFGSLIGLAYATLGTRRVLGTALLITGALLLACSVLWANFNTGIANFIFTGELSWYRVGVWGVPAAFITAGVALRPSRTHSPLARL